MGTLRVLRSSIMGPCKANRQLAMPVKSLNSPVLKWPDCEEVASAVRGWAEKQAEKRPGLLRLGYFGSYARGDWGVGSDLDLVAVVDRSDAPFDQRALQWDLSSLPVAADLLVYTVDEWRRLATQNSRFARTLADETSWVYLAKNGER